MNREEAKRYVEYVVDDSGNGRKIGTDSHAVIREINPDIKYPSKLVGWNFPIYSRSYPVVIAVHSYLDIELSNQEAEELARDYLAEIGFFKKGSFPADYIF